MDVPEFGNRGLGLECRYRAFVSSLCDDELVIHLQMMGTTPATTGRCRGIGGECPLAFYMVGRLYRGGEGGGGGDDDICMLS